jgi:kexin
LLASLLAATSVVSTTPAKRTYDTHDYFALELAPTLSSEAVSNIASSVGVEVVEQIGELQGHWLVRAEKSDVERRGLASHSGPEHIMARWHDLKIRHETSPRSLASFRPYTHNSLRSLSHLTTRKRAKRVQPAILSTRDDPVPDTRELEFAQSTLNLRDPMFPEQWHLVNTDRPDIELNVTKLWSRGIDGRGVTVAIIDDGLDMHSDDLADNFVSLCKQPSASQRSYRCGSGVRQFAEGSYDFNDHTELPEPRLADDQHGTRCAGEVAAVPNNVCGVGVSYRAKIAGLRILSGPISDADEAAALNYKYQQNHIYSCSWGPQDDGQSMEAPEGLILKAMLEGIQNGRDGKGSLFVFAAGNGGGMDDQCNFDGYTNSIFSITIGAIDRKGLHPYYSELCAAMLAVAPSSGSGDHIHTTDVGKDKCTKAHGGTSAAAPLAVGVLALCLQVRPDLTWRDVQHLMVRNSVFFNPDDPDWQDTATGRKFSYKYGYGKIDAGLLVEAAEKWKLVKPQAWFDSPAVFLPDVPAPPAAGSPRQEIPANGTEPQEQAPPPPPPPAPAPPKGSYITESWVESTFEVTQQMLMDFNFETLEHVTARVWIDHQRRGDVEVELVSPNGITSVLARQRRFDSANTGFPGWKFMSMKHW